MISAARNFAEAQRRRSVKAVLLARRAWQRMPDDFDAGWVTVGPQLAAVVSAAQLGAARDGAAYVPQALGQQGQRADPDALVVPRAFSGVAAGGGTLDDLLYAAVIRARVAQVDSLAERLAVGRRHLEAIVNTSVADAGRDAAMAAMVARPSVKWVRIVNPPCCQRCAVLAGRVYSHSTGFQRHPHCQCTMLPQTVANPHAAGIVIGPDDVHDLTVKQRELIADGRDFNKVINDYQRKKGDFLPPTRLDQLSARRSRADAVAALMKAGYLAA